MGQKLSVNLVRRSVVYIHLMEMVAKVPDLLKPSELLKKAVKRYILFMEDLEKDKNWQKGIVPLDVAWIWCCHCLNPVVYLEDMHQLGGIRDLFKTKKDIVTILDLDSPIVKLNEDHVPSGKFKPSMDLEAAAVRQKSFVTNSKFLWKADEKFRIKLRNQYIKFLKLMKAYGTKQTLVPTLGIDLMWHTHMLSPSAYKHDCEKHVGWIINHDDSIPDKELSDSLEQTEQLWKKNFGKAYLNPKQKEKRKREHAIYEKMKAEHEEKKEAKRREEKEKRKEERKKKEKEEKEEREGPQHSADDDSVSDIGDIGDSPPLPCFFPVCGGLCGNKDHSHSHSSHLTSSYSNPYLTPNSSHSSHNSSSSHHSSHSSHTAYTTITVVHIMTRPHLIVVRLMIRHHHMTVPHDIVVQPTIPTILHHPMTRLLPMIQGVEVVAEEAAVVVVEVAVEEAVAVVRVVGCGGCGGS